LLTRSIGEAVGAPDDQRDAAARGLFWSAEALPLSEEPVTGTAAQADWQPLTYRLSALRHFGIQE